MTPTLRRRYLLDGRAVTCNWIDWTGRAVGLLTQDGRQLTLTLDRFAALAQEVSQ